MFQVFLPQLKNKVAIIRFGTLLMPSQPAAEDRIDYLPDIVVFLYQIQFFQFVAGVLNSAGRQPVEGGYGEAMGRVLIY
jgi:hypothetical protein